MGRYYRGKGKLQQKSDDRFRVFESSEHAIHFLTRTRRNDTNWQNVVVQTARDFLDERKTPPFRVQRNALRKLEQASPHHIARGLMHEFQHAQEEGERGAGVMDALWAVLSEGKHLLGIDKLQEWLGFGPKHIPLTDKETDVARAVRQSYKVPGERRKKVGTLERLPQYDTDRIAVWREKSGQLLVTVHGTKLSVSDLADDAKILGGFEARSSELETLLEQLNSEGISYDLAGHSLGTQFITNAVRDGVATGADDILLFNPASSAFQNQDYLTENANDDRYTYFVNQGDLVSQGLYQNMDRETMDNRVHIGPWRYDPLSAHNMNQWAPDEEPEEMTTDEMYQTLADHAGWMPSVAWATLVNEEEHEHD